MSIQSLRFTAPTQSTAADASPETHRLHPEPGRYRVVGFMGCPWCRRVLTARRILGLEPVIAASVAWSGSSDGFIFEDAEEFAPATGNKRGYDPHLQVHTHQELYRRQPAWEQGEATPVPVVVDDKSPNFRGEIVMKVTDEIVHDLSIAWAEHHGEGAPELYPLDQDPQVTEQIASFLTWLNEDLTPYWGKVKNAPDEQSRELAQRRIVEALINLNQYLQGRELTVDGQVRATDVALFATLVPLAAMHADSAYQLGFDSAIKQGADEAGAEAAGLDAVQRAGSPFADWAEVDRFYQRFAADPTWLTATERERLRLA